MLFVLSGVCFFGAVYIYTRNFPKEKEYREKGEREIITLAETILIHTVEKIELYSEETDRCN